MAGQALATDFGEPRMAAYLQRHIFDTAGPLVKAPWCSGLRAVPEGYSCYAANTIESGRKSLKLEAVAVRGAAAQECRAAFTSGV